MIGKYADVIRHLNNRCSLRGGENPGATVEEYNRNGLPISEGYPSSLRIYRPTPEIGTVSSTACPLALIKQNWGSKALLTHEVVGTSNAAIVDQEQFASGPRHGLPR
jgi:hypothetical protein